MKKYPFISAALAAALALAAGSVSAQVPDTTKKYPPAAQSQTPPSQTPNRAETRPAGAITDSAIIAMLQLSHTQEIAAAELAATKAQSDRVKQFAARLKAEHGTALQELQAYAERMRGVSAGVPQKDSARVGRDNNVAGQPDSAMAPKDRPVVRDSATTGRDPNAAAGRPDSAPAVPPPAVGQPGNLPDVDFENLPSLSGHEFDHGFIRLQVTHHEAEINHLRNDVIPMIKDSGLKALVQRQLPILGAHLREAREIEAYLKTTK